MNPLGRREALLGGLLLAAGAAATASLRASGHGTRGDALDDAIPRAIGRWRYAGSAGLVVPEEDEATRRTYDHVLTRVYAAPGRPPVMLLIAYGDAQDAGLAVHRPEACYPAAGYRVDRAVPVPLAGAPGHGARFLTARLDDRIEQIYYWTRIGGRFPLSGWDEKRVLIGDGLRGARVDGVLVRLSTIDDDSVAALGLLAGFNAALLAAVAPEGRALLLGGAAA